MGELVKYMLLGTDKDLEKQRKTTQNAKQSESHPPPPPPPSPFAEKNNSEHEADLTGCDNHFQNFEAHSRSVTSFEYWIRIST